MPVKKINPNFRAKLPPESEWDGYVRKHAFTLKEITVWWFVIPPLAATGLYAVLEPFVGKVLAIIIPLVFVAIVMWRFLHGMFLRIRG